MITDTCHNCGQSGHYRADCPDTSPSPNAPEIEIDKCKICGRAGHWAIACPINPNRLRRIQGRACGREGVSGACRSGEHEDCAPAWCRCLCHQLIERYAIPQR